RRMAGGTTRVLRPTFNTEPVPSSSIVTREASQARRFAVLAASGKWLSSLSRVQGVGPGGAKDVSAETLLPPPASMCTTTWYLSAAQAGLPSTATLVMARSAMATRASARFWAQVGAASSTDVSAETFSGVTGEPGGSLPQAQDVEAGLAACTNTCTAFTKA